MAEVGTDGRNLFHILVSDNPDQDLGCLPGIEANLRSFGDAHPELRRFLMRDDDIRAVLAGNFGSEVLDAYDALVPFAYKADLARYALLFLYGGIYADLCMRLLVRLDLPPGKGLACFRDAWCNAGSSWSVSNGLIRAEPGRPELRDAVGMIVANHRTLNYGASQLHPTGPALFGRAIAVRDRGAELEVGELRNLTGTAEAMSFGYVDGRGRLLCMRMKQDGGDPALLGLRGTNMYDVHWRQRTVWGEPLCYAHGDPRIGLVLGRREQDGIAVDAGMSGTITFGPYATLPVGCYRTSFTLSPDFDISVLHLDVLCGKEVLATARVASKDSEGRVGLGFRLDRARTDLQVRLHAEQGNSGKIQGLGIERTDRKPDAGCGERPSQGGSAPI